MAYYGPDQFGFISHLAPRRTRYEERRTLDGRSTDAYLVWKALGGKSDPPRPILYREELAQRHLLGHLWRGRVFGLIGREDDDPVHPEAITEYVTKVLGSRWVSETPGDFRDLPMVALAHLLAWSLDQRRCPSRLRDAVLGRWPVMPPPRWTDEADLIRRLTLGRRDRWFAVGTGPEWLRHLVIDLDCKEERDTDHFHARLRLLTNGSILPPPHLTVTSRGGAGRHLYWLMHGRTGGWQRSSNTVENAERYTEAVHQRLVRAGVYIGPRSIEVFPKPNERMPTLPFGVRSYLCSPDGVEVEHRDPVDALVAWYRRFGTAEINRYDYHDLMGRPNSGIDRKLLQVVSQPTPSAPRQSSPTTPTTASKRTARSSTGRADPTVRQRDQEVWERGAQSGQTYEDMPSVARFIKFGFGQRTDGNPEKPTPEDTARFRAWIERSDYLTGVRDAGKREVIRSLERKFAWVFKGTWPYPSRQSVRALSADEIHVAADLIARVGRDLTWTQRRGMLTVLLRMMALAEPCAPGQGVALWDTRVEDYHFRSPEREVRLLMDRGVITLEDAGRAPRRWNGVLQRGRCRSYLVRLPEPGGPAYRLWPEHDEDARPRVPILDAVAVSLDDEVGARLYGTLQGWRRFAARRSAPTAADAR